MMPKRSYKPLAGLLLLALAASFSAEAKKVQLQYALQKGDRFAYEIHTLQSVDQEVMGEARESLMDMTQVIQVEVVEVREDGFYELALNLSQLRISGSGIPGDVAFDSQAGNLPSILQDAMGVMETEPISLIMDQKGRVDQIRFPEGILDLVSGLADPTNPEFQLLAPVLQQWGAESSLMQAVAGFLPVYPPQKKIKTGRAWESQSSLDQMVSFGISTRTMVSEVRDQEIILSQQSAISVNEDTKSMEVNDVQMDYDLNGEKNASLTLDSQSGLLLISESVTTISGVIRISSDQIPEPFAIPLLINSTEKVRKL